VVSGAAAAAAATADDDDDPPPPSLSAGVLEGRMSRMSHELTK